MTLYLKSPGQTIKVGLSDHAKRRLRERFPGVTIQEVVRNAVPVSPALRRHLQSMPSHSGGKYWFFSTPNGSGVFVVDRVAARSTYDRTIVTIMQLKGNYGALQYSSKSRKPRTRRGYKRRFIAEEKAREAKEWRREWRTSHED